MRNGELGVGCNCQWGRGGGAGCPGALSGKTGVARRTHQRSSEVTYTQLVHSCYMAGMRSGMYSHRPGFIVPFTGWLSALRARNAHGRTLSTLSLVAILPHLTLHLAFALHCSCWHSGACLLAKPRTWPAARPYTPLLEAAVTSPACFQSCAAAAPHAYPSEPSCTTSALPPALQVFIKGEFIGGSDILMQMHQSGELKKLLEGLHKAS